MKYVLNKSLLIQSLNKKKERNKLKNEYESIELATIL